MTVHRYRRVEDLPDLPRARSALEGLAAACALSELCAAIGSTAPHPRGVLRFRSVQEADARRRDQEASQAR